MHNTQINLYSLTPNSQTVSLLHSIDTLLLDYVTKRVKLLPASAYESIARQDLQTWCHYRNRYVLPTVELVDWLKTRINGRRAIEIGAENSDLAYYLGIPAIGSYPGLHSIAYTTVLFPGQIPTRVIMSDAHQIDIMQAIYELRPEVAIGAWIPDKFASNFYGYHKYAPNDYQIIQNTEYIHIGSEKLHSKLKIREFPHEVFKPVGLISRVASNPPDDVIYIWKKLP